VAEAWTHHDLTVIAVMSVGTSNGEIVDGQLEQLSDQFGTPLGKLCDRGSDLKKTSKCFRGGIQTLNQVTVSPNAMTPENKKLVELRDQSLEQAKASQ